MGLFFGCVVGIFGFFLKLGFVCLWSSWVCYLRFLFIDLFISLLFIRLFLVLKRFNK